MLQNALKNEIFILDSALDKGHCHLSWWAGGGGVGLTRKLQWCGQLKNWKTKKKQNKPKAERAASGKLVSALRKNASKWKSSQANDELTDWQQLKWSVVVVLLLLLLLLCGCCCCCSLLLLLLLLMAAPFEKRQLTHPKGITDSQSRKICQSQSERRCLQVEPLLTFSHTHSKYKGAGEGKGGTL